eukprot:TRINITY_DN1026_c0_g1_i1.p1 TRINITY_DN1026_c0_g1~~TRINITY_DN1026_c0_g1_i1.p1  ORF type:complete len:183 (+),score=24.35 TRINITY_DN1026_c0_g1_i1:47-595(+)
MFPAAIDALKCPLGSTTATVTCNLSRLPGASSVACFRNGQCRISFSFSVSSSRLLGARNSSRVNAFFKFGVGGLDSTNAGIYGSQGRDDYDRDDVEHYFHYMGMLAAEGTYDRLEALMDQGHHAVDILLMMAATEGDRPKIEELLCAGARSDVQDAEGRTALDLAENDEIRELIRAGAEALV